MKSIHPPINAGRTDEIGGDRIIRKVLAVTSAIDVDVPGMIVPNPGTNHPRISRAVLQPRGGDVWIGRSDASAAMDAPDSDGRFLIPENAIYELDALEARQFVARAASADVILTVIFRFSVPPYTGD